MLPSDVNILLSVVNTKLRDKYKNLDELCDDERVDKNEIIEILATINYYYDSLTNQFKEK